MQDGVQLESNEAGSRVNLNAQKITNALRPKKLIPSHGKASGLSNDDLGLCKEPLIAGIGSRDFPRNVVPLSVTRLWAKPVYGLARGLCLFCNSARQKRRANTVSSTKVRVFLGSTFDAEVRLSIESGSGSDSLAARPHYGDVKF